MKNRILLTFFALIFTLFGGFYAEAQVLNTRTSANYTDLPSAISAAQSDDVLQLTQDIDIEASQVSINKRLVIDGDGHTITTAATNVNTRSLSFSTAGSTLKNVRVKKTNNNKQYIIAVSAKDLTFDNVTVEGQSSSERSAYAFESSGSAKNLTIKNCHFQWLNMVGYFNPGTTAKITNNTHNSTSGWNVHYADAIEFSGNSMSLGISVYYVNVRNLSGGTVNSQNNWFTCRIPKIIAENPGVTPTSRTVRNNQDLRLLFAATFTM